MGKKGKLFPPVKCNKCTRSDGIRKSPLGNHSVITALDKNQQGKVNTKKADEELYEQPHIVSKVSPCKRGNYNVTPQ